MRSFTDSQKIIDAVTKISAAFTVANATDTITSASHGLSNGDLITVSNSGGGLPGGLAASTYYYVISATTNTFKVSTTSGGSAIDLTTDGTGTQTFYRELVKYIDVSSFDTVTIGYHTASSANLTIKFVGSMSTTAPDFSQAATASNAYDNIQHYDFENISTNLPNMVRGDTGIALSGTDDQRLIRCDVRGLKWFGVKTSTWSAGTITVITRASAQA